MESATIISVHYCTLVLSLKGTVTAVPTTHLRKVGGVDASRDTSGGHDPHISNKPFSRIEANDVDAAVGCETDRHQALAEPINETVR